MKIAVYGGSFDPIHLGHLAVAEDVASAFEMARVVFVPALVSPLRHWPIAEAWRRVQMCQIATAGAPAFTVSEVDVRREPPSYTVDTLRDLRKEFPEDELHLIVGADALGELKDWRGVAELLSETKMIVVARPGFDGRKIDRVAAELQAPSGSLHLHDTTPLNISSTEIRRRIAAGLPFRHYVHPGVFGYIKRHGLYRGRHQDTAGGADARLTEPGM